MMISNAFGIIVGIVMGKKIPERAIKWGSALIFIAFGALGLYENLPESLLTLPLISAGSLMILLMMFWVARGNRQKPAPVCVPQGRE
jgi:uncharacterized membrane protein